jgi:hypothetical protein
MPQRLANLTLWERRDRFGRAKPPGYPDEPDDAEKERVAKAICRARAKKWRDGPRRKTQVERSMAELLALTVVYHHPELD